MKKVGLYMSIASFLKDSKGLLPAVLLVDTVIVTFAAS